MRIDICRGAAELSSFHVIVLKGRVVRRRISILIVPLFFFGVLQVSPLVADGIPDEQYVPAGPSSSTAVGVQFTDGLFTQVASYLSADIPFKDANGNVTSLVTQALCTSPDDSLCHAGKAIYYLAHLPRCQSAVELDCIGSVFAVKGDGTKIVGTFVSGMPNAVQNPFTGDSKLGIPTPGVDSLWNIPGVINGGGSEIYAVSSLMSGLTSKTAGQSLSSPIRLNEFDTGIFPVKLTDGSFGPSNVGTQVASNGTTRLVWNGPTGQSCVIVSTTQCALHEAFPPGVTFGLSLRLSQDLKGWLHGRLRDPQIDYSSSASGTSLIIQALPTSVPLVDAWTDRSKLPAVIPGTYDGNELPGTSMMAWPWGDVMAQLLKIWLPIIKDTAQAQPSEWIVRNLSGGEMQGADACITNSKTLAGVVTTNSTVYSAGPPRYNPTTESLDYTLVSPHFTSKGEVFKGVYTLAIRSDVARCIYKFTNAPIKATISVTDDSGTSSVAVESMNERDGWIYLSASNFEFSSPTVHVKLSGTRIETPHPTPVVTPTITSMPTVSVVPRSSVVVKKQAPKKVTISCVKGSLIKKVSAVKPVCPKGYKKIAA